MGGARTWQLRACRRVHLLRRLHIRSLLAVFLLNFVFLPHGRRPYWRESLAFFPHNLVTYQLASFSVLSPVSFLSALFCVLLALSTLHLPPKTATDTIFELLGGARMSSSFLVYCLSHESCPYASTVDAAMSLIAGGARIKVKK